MTQHTGAAKAPWEYLDDGEPVATCDLLIIGCGNILRGDDAAGPVLIRRLWAQGGVPDSVRIADGGTSGMDVAFVMRGARKVIIVDACTTGARPGTIYRVPAHEIENPPPLTGLASHDFRWDHALSFGTWLLGPYLPSDISVFLIEGQSFDYNTELSAAVDTAINEVATLITSEYPQ